MSYWLRYVMEAIDTLTVKTRWKLESKAQAVLSRNVLLMKTCVEQAGLPIYSADQMKGRAWVTCR